MENLKPNNVMEYRIDFHCDIECFVFVDGDRKGIVRPNNGDICVYVDKREGDFALSSLSDAQYIYEGEYKIEDDYLSIRVKKSQFEDCSFCATKEELGRGITDEYGVVYSKRGYQLLKGIKVSKDNYEVNSRCIVVRPEAFCYVSEFHSEGAHLTNIIFPANLRYIGFGAFAECVGLNNLIIPDGIMAIERAVFNCCKNLVRIGLPHTLQRIEENAFAGCKALGNIVFYEGLKSIGDCAFEGCGMYNVKFPKSLTYVGVGAFAGCENLDTVEFSEGNIQIGNYAFRACRNLEMLLLSSTVSNVGIDALADCGRLAFVYVPKGMSSHFIELFSHTGLFLEHYWGRIVKECLDESDLEKNKEKSNLDYSHVESEKEDTRKKSFIARLFSKKS